MSDKKDKRPNILLIMTDQHRHDQLGYSSDGYFETPNLDNMANNGVIFENAYTCATICIPSRGSLLTGLRPGRYNTQGNGNALEEGFFAVPHVLRNSGYETALIGKMHLHPIRAKHGFDHMRMAEHLGLVYEPEELDDYTNWLVSKGKGDYKATHIFGPEEKEEKLRFNLNYNSEPFYYDKQYHPTNWIARETIEFLNNRDEEKPFFLITSFPHPHSPFDPPAPYDTMYDPDEALLPEVEPDINSQLPPKLKELMTNTKNFGYASTEEMGERMQRRISTYIRALIKQIDDAVGEILENIDLENTVVFFTSDHGDYYGHRGLMLKTPGVPFDDIGKIPFFISGAHVPKGKRVLNVTQSSDFALTCLELAGIEPPSPHQFDTKSLVPFLKSEEVPDDRTVFCWSNYSWHMIRHKEFKYFYNEPSGEEFLVNVVEDPNEKVNLTNEPAYSRVLEDMRRRMKEELCKGVADLPRFDEK